MIAIIAPSKTWSQFMKCYCKKKQKIKKKQKNDPDHLKAPTNKILSMQKISNATILTLIFFNLIFSRIKKTDLQKHVLYFYFVRLSCFLFTPSRFEITCKMVTVLVSNTETIMQQLNFLHCFFSDFYVRKEIFVKKKEKSNPIFKISRLIRYVTFW